MPPLPPACLEVAVERWPIAGEFRISRGSKTEAEVVVATLRQGGHAGRGESVPYRRYGESVEAVVADLHALMPRIAEGLDRRGLQDALPPGAARNAVDCAFWDLEAKQAGTTAAALAGLAEPRAAITAYTLSLGPAEVMAAAAAAAAKPVLKLKLGGDGQDLARVAAVHAAAPGARLIVDANEAWTVDDLLAFGPALAAQGVVLIEQPLPAGADGALAGVRSPVPLCADESCHTVTDLPRLAGLYSHVNVKLDKTGGLTAALDLVEGARAAGLGLMIGCMVGTSLAMAPALLLAGGADFVDLDGPLLLARDREPGLRYDGAVIQPPPAALWG
ncbi:N-acetyl-D-Glu racemase DgcA [Zavarzinia compransoris]|uniref:Dipeptide epimerase n=1 Tax=Zavarzinia compransoris TaxID=1264899 RepID=A0A317DWV4_9PROT|nr:N-acetyl-D-Glu racemase DgcA [Zavarzinia compransoris]PWR19169.1 dipeptide epimerase [Zavarzinia compransoris]TDP49185.1 L-alanine-DL-glutamate epimerase-like enolase superfamily enzyme [Zavarzinia compransoris]